MASSLVVTSLSCIMGTLSGCSVKLCGNLLEVGSFAHPCVSNSQQGAMAHSFPLFMVLFPMCAVEVNWQSC